MINDLVWVGRAANYAAKLSARSGPPTQITSEVYGKLNDKSKFVKNEKNMWTPTTAPEIEDKKIYTSSWYWEV